MKDDLGMWAKYFSGSCTSKEVEEIQRWITQSSLNAEYAKEMEELWDSLGEVKDISKGRSAEVAWLGVKSRIQHRKQSFSSSRPPVSHRVRPRVNNVIIRPLAVLLGVAILIVLIYWQQGELADEASKTITYTTDVGERITIRLNDGSLVYLSVGSEIRAPKIFSERNREVELVGEAYFDIKPDEESPFIVHTVQSSVQVLGTEFNVRAYPDEFDVELVVTEGQVGMYAMGESLQDGEKVIAGQKGVYKADGSIDVDDATEMQQLIGWREGILEFVETPFEELAHELERWYDVKIEFQDPSLRSIAITARFDLKEGDSFETMLGVLAGAAGAGYERTNKEVVFDQQ